MSAITFRHQLHSPNKGAPMKRCIPMLGFVLVIISWSTVQSQPKKMPTREEDLESLQGRWVQAKPDGKNQLTLTMGVVIDNELIKNYLVISETISKNGKIEVVRASWGTFGLPDEKGRRVIGYSQQKDGIGYKLEDGKLILDGAYDAPSLKQKLTGEWKKLPKQLPLAEIGKELLGKWERKGAKDDPRIVLEFLADNEKKGRIELITRPYRRKDNELENAHKAAIILREEEVTGLPDIAGRADLEKALPRRQYFNREKVPIYLDVRDGKLILEGEYPFKDNKFS